jgi:hypothetical protein
MVMAFSWVQVARLLRDPLPRNRAQIVAENARRAEMLNDLAPTPRDGLVDACVMA